MTTLALLVVLVLSLLVAPCTSKAQQPTHVHRIGRLTGGNRSPDPNLEVFRQELRALGYVEGDNLVLELRYAEGQDERLPALAAELVRLPVEVLVATGAPAARAAQQATTTVPIVIITLTDPVGGASSAAWRGPVGISRGSPARARRSLGSN